MLKQRAPYSLQAAARLAPHDGDIYRALLQENPDHQRADLEKLVSVAPYDAEAWVNLGLQLEAEGDAPGAEKVFNQAYKHDVRPSVTWALTNYYARRADPARYVEWGRRYLAFQPADTAAFFQLGLQVEPDPQQLASDFTPLTCPQTAQFAEALADESLNDQAVSQEVAAAHCATTADLIAAERFTSRLLSEDHPLQAFNVWNALAGNATFRLGPGQTNLLSNPDFSEPITEAGFDWCVNRSQGVQVQQQTQQHAFDFDFDGDQPEHATLLFQPVVLHPGIRYTVRARLRNEDETVAQGFHWRLVELASGRTVDLAGVKESTDAEALVWSFVAPLNPHTLVLALSYDRPAGSGMLTSIVHLDHVALLQQ